ncbi:plant 4,4-dimethylsterol C-4alpha-methyl-monooxygenase [Marchantia polymorpha subsp. ruderalis]
MCRSCLRVFELEGWSCRLELGGNWGDGRKEERKEENSVSFLGFRKGKNMIEFESVAHAEAALNRSLGPMELKWFEWTADVSDFHLYLVNFVFLLIIFTVAPFPSFFLDVYEIKCFEKYRIQPGVHNTKSAAFKCYKDTMKLFFFVMLPLVVFSYSVFKMLGLSAGIPLPSLQTAILQLVTYFIVEDYTNYWIHRWLHSEWGYNNIHRVHHEFAAPLSYGFAYAHVAEMLLLGIPTFLGPAICPCHVITLYFWIALRQLEATDIHSGYDFPFSLTKLIPLYGGAEYHDYHHYIGAKTQSNFASVFTYCDWLYGTDKGYRYHKELLRKMRKEKTT